jgi:predicted membrane GTPase involved in stress response
MATSGCCAVRSTLCNATRCCRVEEGVRKEPFEELMCEVEDDHTGAVIEAVTLRKGEVRRAVHIARAGRIGWDMRCSQSVLTLQTLQLTAHRWTRRQQA